MLKGENYGNQLYESHASRLAINTMINGECGIIDDYGSEMEVTYSGNVVTIGSGFAVVKGGLLMETTSESLTATLTDGLYYSVVLEIDLSKTNTRTNFNQGSFKLISASGAYPTLQQDDISLTQSSGIYQMELARFTTTASAITNFTDKRSILSYNSLVKQLREAIQKIIEEGGTQVSYKETQTSGNEIGVITIDGVETKLYAPEGSVFAYRDISTTIAQYQFNSDESAMQRQYGLSYTIPTGYILVSANIIKDVQSGATSTADIDKMWIGNLNYGGNNNKLLFYIIPKWNDNNYRGHTLTFRLLFMKTSS